MINFLGFTFFVKGQAKGTLHSYTAKSLEGKPIDFSDFKGKKLLIVNTASECGLTPQYKELEKLHQKYSGKGLLIIGFPCNDFGAQEPGSKEEIKTFCERNYGVSFLMMEKVSVKGDSMHPIYRYLTTKSENGVMNSSVKWNFQKYLVNENGQLEDVISPWTQPDHKRIIRWIEL